MQFGVRVICNPSSVSVLNPQRKRERSREWEKKMGKKAKTSRKGKKAWRANISTEDIHDFFEQSTKDALSGGNLSSAPDDALFFVDNSKGSTSFLRVTFTFLPFYSSHVRVNISRNLMLMLGKLWWRLELVVVYWRAEFVQCFISFGLVYFIVVDQFL